MSLTDDIQIPLLETEMTSGVLKRWLVSDGDRVEMGDVLYELAIDDRVFEIENFQSGIVRISGDPGSEYSVGQIVGIVEFTEEDRLEFYHLGVSLDYKQRLALRERCGDLDERQWMVDEFQSVIRNKLGEQADGGNQIQR